MDPTGRSLFKMLFNEGEEVSVSNNEFGYLSVPLASALDGELDLISPNEKSPKNLCSSSDLILVAINPIKGFRRDENVTAFRSFLVELDVGTIKEQLGTITHLGMPTSAQVFSGNKSAHNIITLDQDLPDEKIYRAIGAWILNIVTLADRNCQNPSRSCRIPGAYRESGKQRLISLKGRVSHKKLFDWLNRYEHLRPKAKEKKIIPQGQADFSRLSPWARAQLAKGIDFANRGRNQTFFGLSYDLALAGFSEDQAIEILSERFTEEHDFREKELLTTISSAFRKVSET